MSERVRELEDALAITQARCSDQPHPLLIEGEIQAMKQDSPMSDQVPTGPRNVLDSFGMLNLSDHGASTTFFGPTGGSEASTLCVCVSSCFANLASSIFSWCVVSSRQPRVAHLPACRMIEIRLRLSFGTAVTLRSHRANREARQCLMA